MTTTKWVDGILSAVVPHALTYIGQCRAENLWHDSLCQLVMSLL